MDDYGNMNDGNIEISAEAPRPSWISSYAPPDTGSDEVVNYYFPVQVVFSGGLKREDQEMIHANVLQDLYEAINRRLSEQVFV